jgi:hypothetical protein
LPSAARWTFVWGPEGHLTKVLRLDKGPKLFFLLIISSTWQSSSHYLHFGACPAPLLPGLTIGLPALAPVVMVFARHLDSFTVIWQIRFHYRDSLILTVLSWHENPVHLSGLCKNSCQPWSWRQLIKPPGRYGQFRAHQIITLNHKIWRLNL